MLTIAASLGPNQPPRAPVTSTPSDPAAHAKPITIPELTAAPSGRISWAFTTIPGIMAIPRNPAAPAAAKAGRGTYGSLARGRPRKLSEPSDSASVVGSAWAVRTFLHWRKPWFYPILMLLSPGLM